MKSFNTLIIAAFLFIFVPGGAAFALDDTQSTVTVTEEVSTGNFATRWSTILGIGFAAPLGVYVSLENGCQFSRFFGIYSVAALKYGISDIVNTPYWASDIAVVPKLQFGGKSGQLSLGLGFGYHYYKHTEQSDDYRSIRSTYEVNAFLLRPEVGLDFVAQNGFLIGIGLDVPVYFGYRDETVKRTYTLRFPNGSSVRTNRTYAGETHKYVVGIGCDLQVHLGYKF